MNPRILLRSFGCAILASILAGCATNKPYDYTNFREHPPRSILVLPPLNNSTDVKGTYSYLSTVTFPIAERGYYVFPVAVVDQFLKENGMPTPGEMHEVPLKKVSEIIGADAVMYITLNQYGSKYQLITSATKVSATAKLVDTKTGILLWQGTGEAEQDSSGGSLLGDLIAAAVTQAINSGTDAAHQTCQAANIDMFCTKDHGLLYGPYSPKYGSDANPK